MPAAVPSYVGTDFSGVPPGHRFRLYFDGWWTKAAEERRIRKLRKERDIQQAQERLQEQRDFAHLDNEFRRDALHEVARTSPESARALEALCDRQDNAALALDDFSYCVIARTEAPFVTGMGIDHPVENGFAFYDPHGLPYLPGSSVKGVVRRAAEELALFEENPKGWTLGAVWWLFGIDGTSGYLGRNSRTDANDAGRERRAWRDAFGQHVRQSDLATFGRLAEGSSEEEQRGFLASLSTGALPETLRTRGALTFWDVLPRPPDGGLRVEVMTPHFTDYYEPEAAAPTDDQRPKPLLFLAVPPRTGFRFYVGLTGAWRLPEVVRTSWRTLLESAFEHAFGVLGFGAKTTTGYGRMERDVRAEARLREERVARIERQRRAREEAYRRAAAETRERELAALGTLDRLVWELRDCEEARSHEIFRMLDEIDEEERERLAAALKAAYQRIGKWGRKQARSKKQKAKVQRIKELLGEA